MSVEVDVLGSFQLRRDGVAQRLGGRRERTVLAVLAAAGGRQVGDERLVDEVWGEHPPATAIGSLQVAVSRLRKVLDGAAELRREPAGYLLTGVTLDATDFSRAAASLEAPPHQVLETTSAALARWRGTPYADLLG